MGRLTRNQHILLRLGELVGLRRVCRRARAPCASGRRRRTAGQGRPTLRACRAGRGQPGLRARRGAQGRRGGPAVGGRGGHGYRPGRRPTAGAGTGRADRSARRHDRGRRRALRTGGRILMTTTMEPIAVVGISAIMPEAPDAARFWNNIKSGRYSISDVPPERWDPRAVLRPRPARTGQDVFAHRRLGPRLSLGAAGMEAAHPARGQHADGRRPEVGGGLHPRGAARRRAGRTGPWTQSGSP